MIRALIDFIIRWLAGVFDAEGKVLARSIPTIPSSASQTREPATPPTTSSAPGRSPGHYRLTKPTPATPNMSPTAHDAYQTPDAQVPASSLNTGSSGRLSSGRYKMSNEKANTPRLGDETSVLSLLTEPFDAGGALSPYEKLQKIVVTGIVNPSTTAFTSAFDERRKEQAADAERLAEIVESSSRRAAMLTGDNSSQSKLELLNEWKRKDEQQEEEKRVKFAEMATLVADGEEPVLLDRLVDLISFANRRKFADLHKLEALQSDCTSLLERIRLLKLSEKIDLEVLTALLDQRTLLERIKNGDNQEGKELCDWLLKQFGRMRKKYVDVCYENVDKFRMRDARNELGISKETENAIVGAIRASSIGHIFDICHKTHPSTIGATIKFILDVAEKGGPTAPTPAAFFLFSLFRFKAPDDAQCQYLIQSMQSRCEMCIPSISLEREVSFSLAAVDVFAALVALASYVPAASVSKCRQYWSWKGTSKLPVSLIDGRRWFVRGCRLLSLNLQAYEACAGKPKVLSQVTNLVKSLAAFLRSAGSAILVAATTTDSATDGRSMVLALGKLSSQLVEKMAHTETAAAAKTLSDLCQRLAQDLSDCDDMFIMKFEPRNLVKFLELCPLWERGLDEVATKAEELYKERNTRQLDEYQRTCIQVIDGNSRENLNGIKDINLNANVDSEQWYPAFLKTFEAARNRDRHAPAKQGYRLADYCLHRLCSVFWEKFGADTFRLEPSEVKGLLLLCEKTELSRQDFHNVFRLFCFQRCNLLIPAAQKGDLVSSEQKALTRQANTVGIFALLMRGEDSSPSVPPSPFTHTDGRAWLASTVSFWKRRRRENGSDAKALEAENALAQCVFKFLRPGSDTFFGAGTEAARQRAALLKKLYSPFLPPIKELVKGNEVQFFRNISELYENWRLN